MTDEDTAMACYEDRSLFVRWVEMCAKYWQRGDFEPEVFEILAKRRGWNPIRVGEEMTISVGGHVYMIKRLADK